jgi:hypothetical protein
MIAFEMGIYVEDDGMNRATVASCASRIRGRLESIVSYPLSLVFLIRSSKTRPCRNVVSGVSPWSRSGRTSCWKTL